MSLKVLTFALSAAGLLAATSAEAQVYRWKDAQGNWAYSNRPLDPSATTYAIPGTTFRSTRPIVARRAVAYDALIEEYSAAQKVDPNLVRAVIQAESGFNPRARSIKGAMGLMQLMPATAIELGVTDPYDPAQNIRGGIAYLRQLIDKYNDVDLALAAYNAGPTAVAKYDGIPPYRETRNYVRKIKSSTKITTPSGTILYRIVEIVDGRESVRYSDKPVQGAAVLTHYGTR